MTLTTSRKTQIRKGDFVMLHQFFRHHNFMAVDEMPRKLSKYPIPSRQCSLHGPSALDTGFHHSCRDDLRGGQGNAANSSVLGIPQCWLADLQCPTPKWSTRNICPSHNRSTFQDFPSPKDSLVTWLAVVGIKRVAQNASWKVCKEVQMFLLSIAQTIDCKCSEILVNFLMQSMPSLRSDHILTRWHAQHPCRFHEKFHSFHELKILFEIFSWERSQKTHPRKRKIIFPATFKGDMWSFPGRSCNKLLDILIAWRLCGPKASSQLQRPELPIVGCALKRSSEWAVGCALKDQIWNLERMCFWWMFSNVKCFGSVPGSCECLVLEVEPSKRKAQCPIKTRVFGGRYANMHPQKRR